MNLKAKLQRLSAQQLAGDVAPMPAGRPMPSREVLMEPLPGDERAAGSGDLGGEGNASADAGSSEAAGSPELAELRARMQAIMGKRVPKAEKRGVPELTLLPFQVHEHAAGPLCQRRELLAPSYHVGRIPVDSAKAASSELLGLLGLEPALSQLDPSRALFFDTETTGLGVGTGTCAFLIGLGYFEVLDGSAPEAGALVLEQLLLRSPVDEAAALAVFRERVEACSLLVSFNGKTFDWPLLCDRFVMHRMRPPPERPHLDLLHVARRLHRARIGACRLKSVESEVLGFERDGDIDGADVAPRYAHFLRTGDEEALRAVVDHNLWDVASMAALVGLYGEPFDVLHPSDLLGIARTLKRTKDLERATQVTERALERGAGSAALELRARLHKARGDRARALEDFEALTREVDDPAVRLELAKLYEHFVKDPVRALAVVASGVDEAEVATARRRARLAKKVERNLRVADGAKPKARRRAAPPGT